jgi:hypothetical protein
MKYIYLILLQVCLTAFFKNAEAQCNWSTVGSGATSTTSLTSYQDMMMAPGDIPYVSYCDASLSNAPVVKTFTAGVWNTVGALTTFTNSSYTTIAYNGSTPYLAFSDGSNGGKAYVKGYGAGVWTNLGSAVSTSTASHLSLAVYNGTLYIAYVDAASANRAVVKSYTAGAWTTLGALISTGTASYTSLSIDDSGTPYVIYQDVANSSLATVKKYSAGAWVAVGTGTVSTGAAVETKIDASYNNTPYIAYTSAGNVGTIKTFTAGAWQPVGTGTIVSVYQSLALAVDPAGTPYLGYYELGSYKTSVSKYNGSAWVYAGNNYFSISSPSYHGMAITSSGTPYIAIADAGNGNYVKKLGSASAITLQPLSVSACAGTPTLMTIATNTTGVTYQWQVSTGGVYANVVNGATYSGVTTQTLSFLNPTGTLNGYLYRCVVNDNCTNLISNSATLTVNPLPSVSVSSATSCAGAAKTVTATGAAGYVWSNGNTTSSITVSPTVTTSYSVTGTSALGCSATVVSTVTTIASKNISGNVTSSSGAVSGNMILYKYSPILSKWDSVAFTPFSSIYSFGTVDSSWYVVKAVPTSTNNVMVTYGTSAVSWKGATTITHGCSSNTNHNVAIIPLVSIGTGTGSLSGKIMEGQGYGQRPSSPLSPLTPGQPIGGIVVKGGKNPGGSMFAQTTTGADGTYTLSALPNNAAGESYFLLVDIPGLDTNQTYHKMITLNNSQYTGLDFIVDSAKINPTPFILGVDQLDAIGHELTVFPNPTKNTVTIKYTLQVNGSATIELLDVLGKSVKTVLQNETQLPGEYAIPVNTADLKSGIYFIRVQINGAQNTVKLFICD